MRDSLFAAIDEIKPMPHAIVEQEGIGAAALSDFFEAAPDLPQAQPLPGALLGFTLLYRLALRGCVPDAPAVVEAIEEAADIVNGTLKGRVWGGVLAEHLKDFARIEAEWLESPVLESEDADPFAGEDLTEPAVVLVLKDGTEEGWV